MKLFNYRWPKAGICQESELYYRITSYGKGEDCYSSEDIPQEGLPFQITRGMVVSFDTYFNCFSYAKYREYTRVNKVTAVLNLKGSAQVRLVALREQKDGTVLREILKEKEIHTREFTRIELEYDFSSDTTQGYYYTEITGLENAYCSEGAWETAETDTVNRIKIAVIICTYKREFYLYRNMAMVERDIFGLEGPDSIKDNINIFIVDNGKTIAPDRWDREYIRVFPNKNYGGSGGFTRGIIEAYRQKDEFSHFLLMDDDIVFDAETLAKTVRFLGVLRPEHKDLCIGGSMLRLDIPFLQHEAGGIWNGKDNEAIKPNLDLRRWDAVLENEIKDIRLDYQAWWYICMPFSIVDTYRLPLPFFIAGDDIEYGLRAIKKLEILNGIAVWHQYLKYSEFFKYYIYRNHCVLNVLHRSPIGLFRQWFYLAHRTLSHLVFQRYNIADLILQAANDFLKGPDFFLNTDEEELHEQVITQASKMYSDTELLEQGIAFNKIKYEKSLDAHKTNLTYIILVLLQLYFLPRFFYKRDYSVVDINGSSLVNFLRVRKVLHYNIYEHKGIVTELSKKKVWTLSVKLLFLLVKMLCQYPAVARVYRKRIDELTGFEFWCKHLGIDLVNDRGNIYEK